MDGWMWMEKKLNLFGPEQKHKPEFLHPKQTPHLWRVVLLLGCIIKFDVNGGPCLQ